MSVTIKNTIRRPDNVPQSLVGVSITLSWDSNVDSVAIEETGDFLITGSIIEKSDKVGYWETIVVPNDAITPAGTVYKIIETLGGTSKTYYVDVPSAEVEYWVGDILTATPAWEED